MQINCKENFCNERPLSLSAYCWRHIEDKKAFIAQLEEHNKRGQSMEGFYLKGLSAPAINLLHANLKDANLSNAVLKGASFSDAELTNADLAGANLSECDFIGADCAGANFMMSDLSRARFWHADLTGADLAEANMEKCDFLNAVLFRVNIYHASLKEARFLTRENFRGRNNREGVDEKGAKTARESYANIKQYFISAARYNDISWASYNENRMELRRLWKERRPGLIPFFIMGLLCGWGERPLRATVAALAIIISYAAAFFMLNAVRPNFTGDYTLSPIDYIYYSTITFTTVGYGDFVPKANISFKLLAGSEAFVGIFMMGLFVFTLGRRYSSR
jgi:uncharacterized protein YjbI with pentapeptide repeats